jgi:hypothetical protein
LPKEQAKDFAYIQHNSPNVLKWLVFDVDNPDSFERIEESGLPAPNFITFNRQNGHAHVGYGLDSAVYCFDQKGLRALSFASDVERGITRRLGGDWSYGGHLCKNPLSSRWETAWPASRLYPLETLNDWLTPADKAKHFNLAGLGRNASLFETLRRQAYTLWFQHYKAGGNQASFAARIEHLAEGVNKQFANPLSSLESRGIARSVARWINKHFSPEGFRSRQSTRAKMRWSKTTPLSQSRPWEAEGICRRTWERRRKCP